MSPRPEVPDAPPEERIPMTVPRLAEMKQAGEPIVMVTAYDHPSAQVAEEAGVDVVLVGDTAAMVVLGYDSTTPVGMDEMLMMAAAVRRGLKTPLLIGDMPFGSYEASNEQAIANAQRFVKEAGCDAVKLERGGASVDRARAIVRAGIPVMGHVGLTPQTATALGGFKAQGRTAEQAAKLAEDALALQAVGCFAIVFEAVPGGGHRRADGEARAAGDRDRRRAGDRRPGARLPRPARHRRRPGAAFVQRYAERPRRDDRRCAAPTRRTCAGGAFPGDEHTYSIDPDELESSAATSTRRASPARPGTGNRLTRHAATRVTRPIRRGI